MYFSLPNIANHIYIQQMTEIFLPAAEIIIKNIVKIFKLTVIFVFYYVSSRLLNFPKLIYASL
jgi:hypothetical protein